MKRKSELERLKSISVVRSEFNMKLNKRGKGTDRSKDHMTKKSNGSRRRKLMKNRRGSKLRN